VVLALLVAGVGGAVPTAEPSDDRSRDADHGGGVADRDSCDAGLHDLTDDGATESGRNCTATGVHAVPSRSSPVVQSK
jgi:hypothetical protein